MGLFGKKPNRDELIAQGIADAEAAAAGDDDGKNEIKTGNEKVDMELTKVNAQLDSMGEIRKANSERFSRISEQMGELRGMIVDTNKAMSKVEVAATKSVDLVETVHPEKLMIEVRKQDGKIEALRANIEGNEAIMNDLMSEIKKVREQMNFFKGTEQIIKLNDEVKQELADIKRMEAVIERHADKVETVFLEVEKKFATFDKFDSIVKDLQSGMKKMESDFDKMRVKVDTKEDKKEFVTLVDKFNDFEKHTTNLLKLLDERSKTLKEGLENDFKKLKTKLEKKLKTGPVDLEAPDEPEKAAKAPADDMSGADVAGGDVKKGFLGKLKGFGKKVVEQPLDASGEKEAKPAEGNAKPADEEGEKPAEGEQGDAKPAPPESKESSAPAEATGDTPAEEKFPEQSA